MLVWQGFTTKCSRVRRLTWREGCLEAQDCLRYVRWDFSVTSGGSTLHIMLLNCRVTITGLDDMVAGPISALGRVVRYYLGVLKQNSKSLESPL